MLQKGFGKQLFPKPSCNWFSSDFSVLFLFRSFTSLQPCPHKWSWRTAGDILGLFSQSPSKHWATGGQLSDFHECSFIVPHPLRTSSQGHKQRNSIALHVETLSFVLPSCPAALKTDACSERCLCERKGIHNPRVHSVFILHLWDGWLLCKSSWCF